MALQRADDTSNSQGVAVDITYADHFEAQAEAAITPGTVVVPGTSTHQVAQAGDEAEDVVGWAADNLPTRPGDTEDLRTDYDANDELVVYRGGKFMGILADTETVDKGEKLVPAANGELKSFNDLASPTVAQHNAVCAVYVGQEQVAASGSTERILCKFLGGGN